MKYRVETLRGALLDAAVARAVGLPWRVFDPQSNPLGTLHSWIWIEGWPTEPGGHGGGYPMPYRPSSDWAHGGPIIERERIKIDPPMEIIERQPGDGEDWLGTCYGAVNGRRGMLAEMQGEAEGMTPLVAAMRAYVASKFGEEVDL